MSIQRKITRQHIPFNLRRRYVIIHRSDGLMEWSPEKQCLQQASAVGAFADARGLVEIMPFGSLSTARRAIARTALSPDDVAAYTIVAISACTGFLP